MEHVAWGIAGWVVLNGLTGLGLLMAGAYGQARQRRAEQQQRREVWLCWRFGDRVMCRDGAIALGDMLAETRVSEAAWERCVVPWGTLVNVEVN